MNKEELLKELQELQARLDSEVDSYNIENRVQEIESITAKIDKNNTILKYYSEQLADDKNFVDETPLQYYQMLEAQEFLNLTAKQTAERENEDKILAEQAMIDNSIALISAGQDRIAKLGIDNTQLSIDIRRARLSSNSDKIAKCEAEIIKNNDAIKTIEADIISFQNDIEQHTSVIESLNGLTDNLKEQTIDAQNSYNDVLAKKEASKKGEIDLAKRNKAEAELETLKTITSTLEQRSVAISYDFAGELKNIISDYSNSTITEEQLMLKLSDLKDRLPQDFLKADESARNAEISDNQRAQEMLEVKLEELTRKLSNEDNYKVTPAGYAKIRAKLSTCKMNMSNYDSQIAMLNSQIPANEIDLDEYKEMINLCDEENEEISRQLILNNGEDKELEAELIAKQKMNFTIIAEAKEAIENVNTDGLENTQVLEQLEERKARTEKLIASYQAQLADENAIDNSKKRLDEIELATAKQNLNSLKNREQFLNNSIVTAIDKIIAGDLSKFNGVEVSENNINPLPFAAADGVNPEELNLNSDQDMSPIPVGETNDETKDDFSDLNPDGEELSEEDLNLLGIETPDTKEDEDEKIEEIDTSDVNEKLKNKSKTEKFRNSLKRHWKKVALVLAIILVAVGLKNFPQEKVEKATHSITNNEDSMDNIINADDQQQSLDDFLDKNGLSTDNDKKENDKSNDNAKDDKKDNSEKTSTSNNGGNSSEPYTEKAPEVKEEAADPVDPSTIVDEHPKAEVKPEHADPVDPSTIVDEHPDEVTPTPIPTPTEDEGTKVEESGVTGDETVPDNAWDNQVPTPTDTPTSGSTSTDGVTGNETVPDNAWDNETPVIEGSGISSNQNSGSTTTTVTTTAPVTETVVSYTPTPINTATTTIAVNPGDALIVQDAGVNYVSDNNSVYEKQATDQDIFANDDVKSVSVVTDNSGSDTINVEINSSDAIRTMALNDADVASISKENNISNDEIRQIEEQYKAQQAALEELKKQVQSTEPIVEQNTAVNTK